MIKYLSKIKKKSFHFFLIKIPNHFFYLIKMNLNSYSNIYSELFWNLRLVIIYFVIRYQEVAEFHQAIFLDQVIHFSLIHVKYFLSE